ncbi:MAG: hypothetical protein K5694_03485 [Bacilli bacterium]|nr:hypothetical protein [Bacilli bacterium]
MDEASALKIRPRHFLMTILVILTSVVLCFFLENHAYFDAGSRTALTNTEFFISFGVSALLFGATTYLGYRYMDAKINLIVFFFTLIFTLVGLSALIFFPGLKIDGVIVYTIEEGDLLRYICSTLGVGMSIYLTFGLAPALFRGEKLFALIMKLIVIWVIVMIVFSAVTEFRQYVSFFENLGPRGNYVSPQSFTTNRNIFGMFVFFGIAAEGYLINYRPRLFRWVLMLIFALFEMFIVSKTAMLVTVIFGICFFVYRIVATYKAHPVRNTITIIFAVIMIVGLAFAILFGFFKDYIPRLGSVIQNVYEKVINSIRSSFMSRVKIWTNVWNGLTTDGTIAFLGFGHGSIDKVMYILLKMSPGIEPHAPMDSTYFSILGQYGIAGAILYVVMLGYFFYLIIKAIRLKNRQWFYYLLMWVLINVAGVFETYSFIGFTFQSALCLLLLPIPLMNDIYLSKREDIKEIEKRYVISPDTEIDGTVSIFGRAYRFITPLFIGLVFVSFYINSINPYTFISIKHFLLPLGVAYLAIPFIIAGIRAGFKKHSPLAAPLTISGVLGAMALVLVPYFSKPFVMALVCIGYLVIAIVFASIILFKTIKPWAYIRLMIKPYVAFILGVGAIIGFRFLPNFGGQLSYLSLVLAETIAIYVLYVWKMKPLYGSDEEFDRDIMEIEIHKAWSIYDYRLKSYRSFENLLRNAHSRAFRKYARAERKKKH